MAVPRWLGHRDRRHRAASSWLADAPGRCARGRGEHEVHPGQWPT